MAEGNTYNEVTKRTREWYDNEGLRLMQHFLVTSVGSGANICYMDNAVTIPNDIDREYLCRLINKECASFVKARLDEEQWLVIDIDQLAAYGVKKDDD